ncbi:hypothetical protein DRP04_01315 [Archaeoglobales archaeon]|nr:MAG: hypothetical protein B6U96_13535 [Archaeoglobales archaeon ex4484_92]RLI83463.1 MAG: hypothetical protein DRP04_01315 [Archaeoglobales archaeon]
MWWRWRRRYPGFGPWSDLPPWERPGWRLFGRGRGWYWWYPEYPPEEYPEYPEYPPIPKEEEIKMLEEEERYLEEELERIRRRLRELKGER